jgi:type VI secretion system protein ImpC
MPAAREPISDDLIIDLIPSRIDAIVASLDRRIGRQLDEILHHPTFQALERAWRGLWFVVERTDFTQNIEIEIWPCSKDELLEDYENSTSVVDTALYEIVYSSVYEHANGQPYGAVIADFDFGPGPQDAAILGRCALIAHTALCPFIAGASPAFLTRESFADFEGDADLARHRAWRWTAFGAWSSFRTCDHARAVGLALPRFLLRAPHAIEAPFVYRERADAHEDRCWGRASLAFANRLTRSFALYRWCPNIIYSHDGRIADLPITAEGISTEIALSDLQQSALAELGLIPLCAGAAGEACFYSASSAHEPQPQDDTPEGRAWAMNAHLGAQLPYFFMLTRVMQHLKMVYRSCEEVWNSREDTEKELNDWLSQYVADREVVSAAVRSRRMLRKVRVVVRDVEHEAGWRRLELQMRPHFKHLGAFFSLSLENRLEKI